MWTAVEDTNMKAILVVINITKLAVKIRPEKISGPYGIWTHDHCNTRGHRFKSCTSLNFFQALIFTTGSVVFITARIAFILLYVEVVIKKICCYTLCPSVVNLTALIFLAKLRVVTWSIKKQTHDDNGTEKMKMLLSRDDSSIGKRVLVICDCWIQKINMVLFQTNCIISGKK